ncbi:MAG: electron transport complex subunit RsxC [Candidatus Bipolaricaulota bacterium]|nr:electron transport complex subunit RsxC [Candidatus Bipolaricaulota bacterium]
MKASLSEFLQLRRPGGAHPPGSKLSSAEAIESAGLPDRVVLPLGQHIGAPATPVVKRGDEVKVGQKVAEADGFVSVPIHATVSGKVKRITTVMNPVTGRPGPGMIIDADGDDQWAEPEPAAVDELSNEEILARIKDAGVVGLGGAAFPTHVKLQPPEDKPIHTIIVNGAECEPYITADERLMLEQPDEILAGLRIVMRLLSVTKVWIAIEDNKPQAIARMRRAIAEQGLPGNVEVFAARAKYPMGAEKTLIRTILGKDVPEGGLPMDVGAVVHNVATLAAVHAAVSAGRPLVEKVVTVTGLVRTPKNLLVRIGTPASQLGELCGGVDPAADQLIFGGPMMGIAQPIDSAATVKCTNCVLFKKSDLRVEHGCIRCGRCVEACPMDLMPLMYVNYVKKEEYDDLSAYYIDSCVECGACAYNCPSNIPIVSYIKEGKAELRKQGAK